MTDTNHIEVLREIRRVYIDPETIAALDAAITALSARASAGEGGEWVLVPREPTPKMIDSTFNHFIETNGEAYYESHNTRNRRIYTAMIDAAPQPAQAGASGGVWAPTCQKCRMTIARPGECAIGGQHCQCSATPASPATGDAATWEEEIRRHEATPPARGDGEGDDAFGDMPAPIGNPEAWPPNYADGYNDAVRNMVDSFPSVRARLTTRPTPEAQEARDAARYRFLRDVDQEDGDAVEAWNVAYETLGEAVRPEVIDAAIDAALALPAQGEGKA